MVRELIINPSFRTAAGILGCRTLVLKCRLLAIYGSWRDLATTDVVAILLRGALCVLFSFWLLCLAPAPATAVDFDKFTRQLPLGAELRCWDVRSDTPLSPKLPRQRWRITFAGMRMRCSTPAIRARCSGCVWT